MYLYLRNRTGKRINLDIHSRLRTVPKWRSRHLYPPLASLGCAFAQSVRTLLVRPTSLPGHFKTGRRAKKARGHTFGGTSKRCVHRMEDPHVIGLVPLSDVDEDAPSFGQLLHNDTLLSFFD